MIGEKQQTLSDRFIHNRASQQLPNLKNQTIYYYLYYQP